MKIFLLYASYVAFDPALVCASTSKQDIKDAIITCVKKNIAFYNEGIHKKMPKTKQIKQINDKFDTMEIEELNANMDGIFVEEVEEGKILYGL